MYGVFDNILFTLLVPKTMKRIYLGSTETWMMTMISLKSTKKQEWFIHGIQHSTNKAERQKWFKGSNKCISNLKTQVCIQIRITHKVLRLLFIWRISGQLFSVFSEILKTSSRNHNKNDLFPNISEFSTVNRGQFLTPAENRNCAGAPRIFSSSVSESPIVQKKGETVNSYNIVMPEVTLLVKFDTLREVYKTICTNIL